MECESTEKQDKIIIALQDYVLKLLTTDLKSESEILALPELIKLALQYTV